MEIIFVEVLLQNCLTLLNLIFWYFGEVNSVSHSSQNHVSQIRRDGHRYNELLSHYLGCDFCGGDFSFCTVFLCSYYVFKMCCSVAIKSQVSL